MNFCKPNQAHEDEKCTFFPSVPSLIFHFPHSELHLAIFQFHFVVALIHFPHSPQNEIMYHFPCPFKAVLLGCISAGQVPAVPCFSMLDYFSGKEGNFIIFKILNCGHLYGGGCTLKCIPVKWQCHQICRIELRETVGKNKKHTNLFRRKSAKCGLSPFSWKVQERPACFLFCWGKWRPPFARSQEVWVENEALSGQQEAEGEGA